MTTTLHLVLCIVYYVPDTIQGKAERLKQKHGENLEKKQNILEILENVMVKLLAKEIENWKLCWYFHTSLEFLSY